MTAPTADDTFVGGQLGAVLQQPAVLDAYASTREWWGTMVARHRAGLLHGPVQTDTHVPLYYDQQPLTPNTPTVAIPRESVLTVTEPCILRLSRSGVDGEGSGPHLTIVSVRRPDITNHALHN